MTRHAVAALAALTAVATAAVVGAAAPAARADLITICIGTGGMELGRAAVDAPPAVEDADPGASDVLREPVGRRQQLGPREPCAVRPASVIA